MPVLFSNGIDLPDTKWIDYKRWFLLSSPNQTLEPGEANLSDNDWIKHKIILMIRGQVLSGKRIEQEAAQVPGNADDIEEV